MAIRIVNPHHRPPAPSTVKASILFAVEGMEQAHFFKAFLRQLPVEDDVDIWNLGGKDEFKANLALLAKESGFIAKARSLGVVRDANHNAAAAFQSVQDALGRAELAVPEKPLQSAGDRPRLTVMILPGRGRQGMLEDLCLEAVEDEPAMRCVKGYFECLREEGVPPARNPSKSQVRVFLASRERLLKRLGEAAQAEVWPWTSEVFNEVRCFVRHVCSQKR